MMARDVVTKECYCTITILLLNTASCSKAAHEAETFCLYIHSMFVGARGKER